MKRHRQRETFLLHLPSGNESFLFLFVQTALLSEELTALVAYPINIMLIVCKRGKARFGVGIISHDLCRISFILELGILLIWAPPVMNLSS